MNKFFNESKVSLHIGNIEYGVERIGNKVKGAKITYNFDDEDCFIDVTEKNGNLWSFTIDFGSGYVYMLEPKEDRGSFGTDNEAFDVIISMLQGKRFNEKKSVRKSLKEYRTVGFEQLVRDTIVSVLEDSDSDLFDLGMSDGILTYDVQGRSRVTSNGDVEIDYLTLPTYFWSSGYTPSNKKMAKLCEDMMDSQMDYARERLWDENKDELIELGITDKDDENLEYHALYDMGAGDLAEELSEYEMDLEGMDLYTDIYCELEETDEGIELTVSMAVQDEYGHALVKDYKSNTVLLQEDDDLEEVITDAIREVTKQF